MQQSAINHVVLQTSASSSGQGRRIWLRPGQEVVVGRADVSDLVFPEDRQLSGRHFLLQCGIDACRVSDCQSTNGLFVNGQRAAEAILRDGDRIRAGNTEFEVTINGGEQEHMPAVARIVPAAAVIPAGARETLPAAGHFGEDQLESGISEFFGLGNQPRAVELIELLKDVAPLHLIVDFPTLGLPRPAEIDQPAYLFSWLPLDVSADVSPIVISADEIVLEKVVNPCWGYDALVCLFSSQDSASIIEHFRTVARGYHLPSTLSNVLSLGGGELVGRLMEDLDLVLVEGNEPTKWRAFGKGEMRDTFEQLGFNRLPVG